MDLKHGKGGGGGRSGYIVWAKMVDQAHHFIAAVRDAIARAGGG